MYNGQFLHRTFQAIVTKYAVYFSIMLWYELIVQKVIPHT